MKEATLGALEKQVMHIIWQENSCSIRDVLTKLPTDKKLAYTTVATVLQRLYDKGLLKKKGGKLGFIYSPKVTKASYSKKIARSFLTNFIDSFGDTAIASFAESIDTLPEEKREYLRKLLNEHDTNK